VIEISKKWRGCYLDILSRTPTLRPVVKNRADSPGEAPGANRLSLEEDCVAVNLALLERAKLLIVSLVATASLSSLLKRFVDIPRPCQVNPSLYPTCLPDYAFPSGHVSDAFSFVFPFLGHWLLPCTYFVGLLIGWSRASIGLHSILDVGGGIAVAGFGYNFAQALILRNKKTIHKDDESARQALHAASNLLACLMVWLIGIETTSYLVLAWTCLCIIMLHAAMTGIRLRGSDMLERALGRRGEVLGEGSLYNALGLLFILGILRGNSDAAIAAILIFGLGDSISTYLGSKYGKHKLPWNNKKSAEGSLGFLTGGMISLLILPQPVTALAAILATFIESLPIKLNDNLTVPMAVSLIFYFLL
jgi:dolichol kinase